MDRAENCEIRAFHVFDGSERIQEFNDLHLSGEHRSPLDGQNTFTLSAPRTVLWGMGLTFFVQAAIGFDTVPSSRA